MCFSVAKVFSLADVVFLTTFKPLSRDAYLHNTDYRIIACTRKVRMSHICKVEMSHFPVDQAGLECVGGIGNDERARAEPD
jgi:hypothetical protein